MMWNRVSMKPGFQRVYNPLAESRGRASGGVRGKPCIKPSSVSHRVNLETVSTVSKEGHALQVKAAPFTFTFRYIAFDSLL